MGHSSHVPADGETHALKSFIHVHLRSGTLKPFIHKNFRGARQPAYLGHLRAGTLKSFIRAGFGTSPRHGENWKNVGAEVQAHLQKEVA